MKHTDIREKDLSNYNYLDNSIERKRYFANVIKSIEKIEQTLHNIGFSNMFLEQSPFSSSCYFTFNRYENGKCKTSITIRISDHENPNGFDTALTDELISRFGYFELKQQDVKEYEAIGMVD